VIINAWILWVILGVICIILEMLTPTFFFMSLGIGAILTGILSLMIGNTVAQILMFIIISFLSFLILRKISRKVFIVAENKTNIYALIGATGVVVKDIQPYSRGRVKIRGEEWSAESEDKEVIHLNEMVVVRTVSGNKVIVAKKNSNP
jgi:membrane protein implicated in regulation of membrane protease activity